MGPCEIRFDHNENKISPYENRIDKNANRNDHCEIE